MPLEDEIVSDLSEHSASWAWRQMQRGKIVSSGPDGLRYRTSHGRLEYLNTDRLWVASKLTKVQWHAINDRPFEVVDTPLDRRNNL